jgi:hypothetical protein
MLVCSSGNDEHSFRRYDTASPMPKASEEQRLRYLIGRFSDSVSLSANGRFTWATGICIRVNRQQPKVDHLVSWTSHTGLGRTAAATIENWYTLAMDKPTAPATGELPVLLSTP